jgi:hypothetical protein
MAGRACFEQFQPLNGKLRTEEGHSGDVSTRSREADHQAIGNRVAHDRHNDRDSSGRCLCSAGSGGIAGNNEIEVETDELFRELRESLNRSIRGPVFDSDVLPLHITPLAQPSPKGI